MHFIESINNIPLRVTRTKNSHTTVGVCVFHCNKVANIRATHPVVFYCFKSLFFENNVFHIFYLSFLFNDLRGSCFFVSLYSISIYNSQHNKYCYYSICKKNLALHVTENPLDTTKKLRCLRKLLLNNESLVDK